MSWIKSSLLPGGYILDLRSLALFRILFGLLLLYDIYLRTSLGRFDLAWYTDDPPHRSYLHRNDTPHKAPLHRVWFYRGSVEFETAAFGLSAFLSLLYCLGLFQNAATKLLLFVVQVAQHSRCMHLSDGSDSFSRHLLLWSCFLPLSERWSLDAVRRTTNQKTTKSTDASSLGNSNNNNTICGLACLAITTQVMLMYVGTIFNRIWDDSNSLTTVTGRGRQPNNQWLPPELSAVHYALLDCFASRDNALTRFIVSNAVASKSLTLSATVLELLAPIFCLLWERPRHWGALALMGLHVGLFACFNLPNWQILGFVTQSLWIPTHVWDSMLPGRPGSKDRRRPGITNADYKKTDGDPVVVDHSTTNKTVRASARPLSPNLVSLGVQIFFFSYMIYNWAGNRGWIAKHDNGDIGEGLRLSQYWVMYGSTGKRTAMTRLIGKTQDDKHVDLYHYIKTKGREEIEPVPDGVIITDMTNQYPSPRWERAIAQWALMDFSSRLGQQFISVLCVLLNDNDNSNSKNGNVPPHFVSIELKYSYLHIFPPGQKEHYAEEERQSKVRDDQSIVHSCLAPSLNNNHIKPPPVRDTEPPSVSNTVGQPREAAYSNDLRNHP